MLAQTPRGARPWTHGLLGLPFPLAIEVRWRPGGEKVTVAVPPGVGVASAQIMYGVA